MIDYEKFMSSGAFENILNKTTGSINPVDKLIVFSESRKAYFRSEIAGFWDTIGGTAILLKKEKEIIVSESFEKVVELLS
jgi:hypothetical protein